MSEQINEKPVETTPVVAQQVEGDAEWRTKLLQEKKNWSEKAKALAAENEALKTEKLKEKEDWKTMAEMAQKKAAELELEKKAFQDQRSNEIKFTAIKKELSKMGLRDDKAAEAIFNLSNKDVVKYDPELNVVMGAEEEARRVVEAYGFKPLFGQSTVGVSHAAPHGSPSQMNAETYNAMVKDGSFHKLTKLEQREITSKVWAQFGVKRN